MLVRHGAVPDYQTAFDEYLAKGAKAYIARKLYRPAEATELMVGAGVVPVLAHPFTINLPIEEIERFTDELIEAGLKGIEGYHGDCTSDEQAPLRELGGAQGTDRIGGERLPRRHATRSQAARWQGGNARAGRGTGPAEVGGGRVVH